MSRIYKDLTLSILKLLSEKQSCYARELFKNFRQKIDYKDFYNAIFRLHQQELILKEDDAGKILLQITGDGKKLLSRSLPERDGVWKLVIFDIPEKQKYVRTVLRAKLKALHFKKWQNSIWISPYALDEEIEAEFKELSKKFFVRLIKTTDINNTQDLEKLFT